MVCSLYACKEGCGNKEVNADLTISFPPSVNTPILEYIDTVKYLKLEDKDEALLAYVNKMVCREDKIYLGGFFQSQNSCLRYNRKVSVCDRPAGAWQWRVSSDQKFCRRRLLSLCVRYFSARSSCF